MNIKQPTLGIISTGLCIVTVFVICALFIVDVFNTWVGYVVVAAIPGQITLALVWECNYPASLTKLKQPLKGIVLTILMALIGAITVAITLPLIGGGITPPTPMLIQFTILSVLISMWTVVAWKCWPMSAFSENPAIVGIGTLILTYILTYVVFTTLFDYSFMADAPFYVEALDPGGLLNAWTAITYILTTVAVIDALILLDFWPLSSLQEKHKALQAQPIAGLLNSAFILIVAYAIWYLFIKVLGFEIVDYMVRVVVAFVFGEFIMLVMMQTAPFTNMKQPYKGACLLLCCAVLAVAMYQLYAYASLHLVGEVASGLPTYDLDLWLATAMLGITFPLLIIFADFFQFWPLNKSNAED